MKIFLINFIKLIINNIRFLLGPKGSCKFIVTCSEYAEIQFKTKSFFKAFYYIIKRLIKCTPFSKTCPLED